MLDKFHEECGVFGIAGSRQAAHLTYLGLYALQHRGQEATGIVSTDGKEFYQEKGVGLVSDLFNQERLDRLKGEAAIGHNRYSTTGENSLKNVQPIMVNFALGTLALAHNGNLTNAAFLRDELEAYGAIFQSTSDSEVIIHLIAQSQAKDLMSRLIEALQRVKGAYSLVILTDRGLIGARDAYGLRPLSLGRVKDAWVLASETCAFDLIDAEFVRDIEPGELVMIDAKGVTSYKPFPKTDPAFCVFEYVYFSRPDSRVYDHHVYEIRKELGRQLAREAAVAADIVIPVPDSGVPAALGYAEAAHLRYETGLIRNHYVGRTFIEPEDSIRHFGVKIKLNAVRDVLEDKRVVVVDDSIVRGTTSRKIIKMIRQAGAREVHLRISSPPIISPCYYGIDTPTRAELIASSHSIEEIRSYITADSLAYLSMEGMLTAVPHKTNKYCAACFSGEYPIPFTQEEMVQIPLFEPKPE
jgi:amidophosphoribosyltransferase